MTQEEFYKEYPMDDGKEQRLVLDLRDCGLSWSKISLVFLHLKLTPYSEQWNIQLKEPA